MIERDNRCIDASLAIPLLMVKFGYDRSGFEDYQGNVRL
jgi:hypothetical protein